MAAIQTTSTPGDLPGHPGADHPVLGRLDRARYMVQQLGLAASLSMLMRGVRLVLGRPERPPNHDEMALLRQRFEALLARDLDHVARGLYPRELLFQLPVLDYLRVMPEALRDLPRVARRKRSGAHDELPDDVDLDAYPRYYRRTFHWQTDGWFSDRSARLYDLSVEVLFTGTADVMRRMAIPPVVEALEGLERPRVLDLACGTGRFLLQLHAALPHARLYGLDLSPHYLKRARSVLAEIDDLSLVHENAEATSFADATFDAVTSVFLFHELPTDARRNVIDEAWRVLRPGGVLVLNDSMQLSDSPRMAFFLDQFAHGYHEPYYKSYIRDDLASALTARGFSITHDEPHFVSKVVVGRKPDDAAP